MKTEKILAVVSMYRTRFEVLGITKKRIDPTKCFKGLTDQEILAHAHYLLDGIETYAKDPDKQGKTGRHLASVQIILSFAGWYTLEELMNHNRPD